jgi:hypothetical protein
MVLDVLVVTMGVERGVVGGGAFGWLLGLVVGWCLFNIPCALQGSRRDPKENGHLESVVTRHPCDPHPVPRCRPRASLVLYTTPAPRHSQQHLYLTHKRNREPSGRTPAVTWS